jgi:dihydroneopterin aldolase
MTVPQALDAADLQAAAELIRDFGADRLAPVAELLDRLAGQGSAQALAAPAVPRAEVVPLRPLRAVPAPAAEDEVRIVVKDMVVELRIGIHPWEKHRPQRVIVNVEMFARAPAPGAWRELGDVLDYDRIRDRVKGDWPDRPHVDFLETYVEELIALCFADPKCEAARVSITKPDIFPETAAVGVEVFRRRPRS